jgi:hypothetical protein
MISKYQRSLWNSMFHYEVYAQADVLLAEISVASRLDAPPFVSPSQETR